MNSRDLTRYPRLALSVLRSGRADAASASLPDTELTVPDSTVDPRRYAEYCRFTGFRVSGGLPITLPHLLGFDSALRLFTQRGFPFSPVGMVHAHNRIVQYRVLAVDEPLSVRVRLDGLAPHPKGARFDTVTEADSDGETVWRETSTYVVRTRNPKPVVATEPRVEPRLGLDDLEALWRVPGDTGRRYAAMSGDYNPIHLHRLSARAFGQRRAIAHGMWTLARCLGALESRLPATPLAVETDFRRPLPLPAARVALCTRRQEAGWQFGLFDPKTGKPYLTGTAAPA